MGKLGRDIIENLLSILKRAVKQAGVAGERGAPPYRTRDTICARLPVCYGWNQTAGGVIG